MASNTGCMSADDREIPRSTSAVAVCCSSSSFRSRMSRYLCFVGVIADRGSRQGGVATRCSVGNLWLADLPANRLPLCVASSPCPSRTRYPSWSAWHAGRGITAAQQIGLLDFRSGSMRSFQARIGNFALAPQADILLLGPFILNFGHNFAPSRTAKWAISLKKSVSHFEIIGPAIRRCWIANR